MLRKSNERFLPVIHRRFLNKVLNLILISLNIPEDILKEENFEESSRRLRIELIHRDHPSQ